ncbi:MAG: hypothetical protein NZZ41_04065 [Candidatus Dojkabacteria bacterium]|nr:hypothetical protein [Candidatus Dojkabacteria bacterium]
MKNFIDELVDLISNNSSSKFQVLEKKSIDIIISSNNFMKELKKIFNEEEFNILQKKFFLAIKNNDPNKFISKYKYLLNKKLSMKHAKRIKENNKNDVENKEIEKKDNESI